MKKQHSKNHLARFPRIYRFITEVTEGIRQSASTWRKRFPRFEVTPSWRKYSRYWVALPSIALGIALLLTVIDTYKVYQKKQEITHDRARVHEQIQHWESVVGQYKDYRDGYFTLATLEYQLGNKKKAQEYLKKTFELDPNFMPGRELELLLEKE